MPISLEKVIFPGTWRYLGQRVGELSPSDIPIAGLSMRAIHLCVGGDLFRVGRVAPRNAFVLQRGVLRLLYVRPDYTAYRRTARLVFKDYGWKVDFDHALGRNAARQLGYTYVLLTRANPRVNRSHGRFERLACGDGRVPEVCFVDTRIHDKLLHRKPLHFSNRNPRPYDPGHTERYGVTLQQAGRWAYALGVDDELESRACLIPIRAPIA